MQANKINGFNNMFGKEKKDYTNYHSDKSDLKPKKVAKTKKNTQKKQPKPKKSSNNAFHPTKIKKHSHYGNIRVKQSIVDKLGVLQAIVGTHSRSDLLEQMIKNCKGAILNTSSKHKFYKKSLDKIKEDRRFKKENVK